MIYVKDNKKIETVDAGTSESPSYKTITWLYLELDSDSDFDDLDPSSSNYPFSDFIIIQGSEAHVIGTNKMYMMQSDGTWVIQDEASRMDVYTTGEVNQLLTDMADAQSDVDYDQDKEIQLNRELISQILNTSYKNRARIYPDTATYFGTTFTVDKDAGTITTSGTATGYKSFRFLGDMDNTGYQYAIPIPRGIYYLQGIPSGASTSTFRYILGVYTDSAATRQTNYIYDNNYVLTVDNDTTRIDLAAYISQGNVFQSPTVWRPFIIEQTDYYADPTFVPYCPTPMEMWHMMRQLHNL